MSRAVLVLTTQTSREVAASWCLKAPINTRVEFKAARRSLPQSARMWAHLTDIARQTTHHGLKLTAADWKLLFLDALKREVRTVPNLDGNGLISLGRSSSDLSKEEMAGLITIIEAWAAQNDVTLTDPVREAA